ncbi:porin [Aeromonas veronii]|uniref:porin n=1 Tax=Aeromonas veronii TaxID=654 RepID=UPI0029D80FD8|nr:porin [Aeromonas veronii]MDX7875843.1 porin [Aeromonas veronii]
MKKTILAIAIPALFASAANAAVIYDKDGTQVGITGNLRTQFASKHDDNAEDLAGRARIGLSTKVALNDTWSGLAKGEWQLTSNKSGESNGKEDDITSREVYVGLDGSQFGMIRFGQLDTVFNDVINKADIANENSGLASVYDGRQEGQVRYDGKWNGVSFGASYITANTDYKDVKSNNGIVELTGDLDRGYAAKLGYEAPFGLALIAGLEQKEFNETVANTLESKKDWGLGASYTLEGLYLGASYSDSKVKYDRVLNNEEKTRGYELAASYNVDAWTPYVVYNNAETKETNDRAIYTTLGLTYNFTSNFLAYSEYVFENAEANSDDVVYAGLFYAF